MKTLIGYCRVSTANQKEEKTIEIQEKGKSITIEELLIKEKRK